MKQEPKKEKKDPIKQIIESWKKIDSEQRVFIIIIAVVALFLFFMPTLYKGWVKLRDHSFDLFHHSSNKMLSMTCSQFAKDNNYETSIETVIYYLNDELKKENYKLTMKAISENGKKEIKDRKELYDITEQAYKKYAGFTAKTSLKNNTLTFSLATDYSKIQLDKINKENEESDITVDLEFNQDIDQVKSYYENLGLNCKK